ncbi:hypothetical protein [Pontixanthobacter sp.]|uniref:hypothetical protein n=1 Tax=Pontixanthobacter sp. TaxID=2792078 RepID=UPI003C797405
MIQENNGAPSGETKLKARRGKFWRYLAIAFLASFAAGIATGYLTGMFEDGALPMWVLFIVWALVFIGLAWFTRDYFRRIDELDLMDNLWSHLVGYYAAVLIFGLWYLLHDIGEVAEPAALPIILVMIVVTFIAYGARKLGFR